MYAPMPAPLWFPLVGTAHRGRVRHLFGPLRQGPQTRKGEQIESKMVRLIVNYLRLELWLVVGLRSNCESYPAGFP